MISSGKLTERITFLQATVTRSASGEQVESWANVVCTVWATVTFNKGARAILAGEIWNPTTIAIKIRYRTGLNEKMRIVWQDKAYVITSFNATKLEGEINILADLVNE